MGFQMTSVMNSQSCLLPLGKSAVTEIDYLMHSWAERRTSFLTQQAAATAQRHQFIAETNELIDQVVRPTLEAIAERLRADFGRVEVLPTTQQRPVRVTLWMSLNGEVAVPGRQDLNPYLQLDLDVPNRRFRVWEGDIWQKQGASRSALPWRLNEVTMDSVAERVIAILARASGHDINA